MAQVLPLLSGRLKSILEEVAEKGEPISKHILEIDKTIDEIIKIKYYLGERLLNMIVEKLIDPYLTGEVTMLSFRNDSNNLNVSFLPKGKDPEYTPSGAWARRNRQDGKPAKILQKALVKQFKQVEWENFSNMFKAEACECNNFEIVSGEDIRKWYKDSNYYECSGTLGNSCMRYESAQSYFDVYVDNAKMLITKKAGKLTGRAIVWEIDENTTILDRVYTCFDYLTECFFDYAKERKWIIRSNNSLLHTGDEQLWLTANDNYTNPQSIPMQIVMRDRYDEFPYVDSFRYYNYSKNILTNTPCNSDYSLDSTDGEYNDCSVRCEHCGRIFYGYTDEDDLPDELHYSEWASEYLCDNCCYWSEFLQDYIPYSEDHVEIYTRVDRGDFNLLPRSVISDFLVKTPEDLKDDEQTIVKVGDYYYDTTRRRIRNELVFNADSNEFEFEPQTSNDWSPDDLQVVRVDVPVYNVEPFATYSTGTFYSAPVTTNVLADYISNLDVNNRPQINVSSEMWEDIRRFANEIRSNTSQGTRGGTQST